MTVFGFLEAQVGRQTQDAPGTTMFGGSRVGFIGDEDLGDGLKASLYLEQRFNPDDGAVNSPFRKGGSWVGLSSPAMGSVKVGRWWSQAFLKSQFASDPFGMGTLGEGTYGSVGCGPAFRDGCLGAFWVNNAVSYEHAVGGSYDVQDQGGQRLEQLLSLGYKYFLSKRTNIFAVVANDSKAPSNTHKSGYAPGIFHAF